MRFKAIKSNFFYHFSLLCFCLFPLSFTTGQVIQVNASQVNPEEEQIQLNGPWKFHYGDFLDASQMQKIEGKKIDLPFTWTGEKYNGRRMENKGHATYYTLVVLPENLSALGFYMPTTYTNYKVFINGHKMGEAGSVADHAEVAVPRFNPQTYQLPFQADTLDIIIHISNYDYRKGGLWRTPSLGKITTLMEAENKRIQMDMFLIGAILLMGMYHIGANSPHFQNKESLFLALLCFATVIRLLCDGDYILTRIFPDLPFNIVVKTEFIGFFLAVAMSIKFYQHAFRHYKQPLRLFKFFFYAFILLSTLTIFSPVLYASYLVPVAQIITVATIIVFFIVSIKPAFKGDQEIIHFMMGMMVMCLAVVNYIFNISGIAYMDTVNSLSALFFFLCASVIVARRFNKAYFKVRKLSDELTRVNAQLENKVQQRTRELAEKNQDLKKNNIELEKINKEKDGLMHVVAHDLKSPLNRNLGLIEVVQTEGSLNETQEQMLGLMKQNNHQGIDLIHEILQKYSPQKGYQPSYALFEVGYTISDLLEGFSETLNQKNLSLHKNLPEKETYFTSDETAITRILENLVSNSIKFSASERYIWVDVEVNEENMTIICKDEGPGFTSEDQELLFKKYQKLSAQPTGGENSTGLGLSIVKDLVDQLGGSINVDSKEGKGTTFTVIIPAATVEEEKISSD